MNLWTAVLDTLDRRRDGHRLRLCPSLVGIAFAAGLSPVSAQQCLPVPDGRVAWFTGDHMYDTIVARNMATPAFLPGDSTSTSKIEEGLLANGVAIVSGRVGKAFQFDGVDDRITVRHYLNLGRTPEISAECWIRSTGPQLTTGNVTLLDKSHGFIDRSGWDLEVSVATGQVVWTHGNFATRDSLSGTSNVLDGQFHHVAATFDGATIRVYVDGMEQASKTTAITLAANTRDLNIGFHFGGGVPQRFFKGIIDEATVYQRALGADEILEIYAAGGRGKCVGAKQFQRQKLLPVIADNVTGGGGFTRFFGGSLTALGDTLFALNPEGTYAQPSNVVYLYKKSGSSWVLDQKIFPTSASTDFGRSLAAEGGHLLIGSPTGGLGGKVSLYRSSGTSWVLETANIAVSSSLSPSPGGFGLTADLDGSWAIVGSYADDLTNDGNPGPGAAYLIERSSTGSWTIKQRIAPGSGSNGMFFGYSVAVDANVVLVGAPNDDQAGANAGAVFVFELNGTTWTQTAKLLPWSAGTDGTFANDHFGASVAYRNGVALIGAGATDDVYQNGGAVYALCRVGSSWVQEAKLFAMDGRLDNYFGSEKDLWAESRFVALNDDGDLAIIGARVASGLTRFGPFPLNQGAAYFYRREIHDGEPIWTEKAKLLPSDGNTESNFGSAVGMVEGAAFVGRPWGGTGSGNTVRGIYVFDLPVNRPPVANAGLDQVVDEGSLVQLDGSASSDPDGDYLFFQWTQFSGPAVTISDPTAIQPTFTAPLVNAGGTTLVFQLTVDDGKAASQEELVTVTVRNVNSVPTADAGPDQTAGEGSVVTLDGANSFDEDGDPLTYQWIQTAGPVVTLSDAAAARPSFGAPLVGAEGALLTFELTIDDGIDVSVPDSVSITIENINHSPIADAGRDQTVDEEQVVGLDGSNSNDPDTDPITFLWYQTAGPLVALSDPTSATPTFQAPMVIAGTETLEFELTVCDSFNVCVVDSVTITVRDVNAPPDCHLARPSSEYLWPPNHKMVAITIAGVTDPNDDRVAITITGVRQDEPIDGLGDGDTGPDAVIQGNQVLLRAERSGLGNGRVYHVEFRADDGEGGWCTGTVTVCVPHSMKKPIQCTDDGAAFDSTR
ncbi:MAG: LamG-like jellyroll fold domain-containing protein [Planctomycetota bacterium]